MKYTYEYVIEYDMNMKEFAEDFISTQFPKTVFLKMDPDNVLNKVSVKAWNDAMSYVGRYKIKDKAAKDIMQSAAFEAIKKLYIYPACIAEDYATESIPDMNMPEEFKLGVWQKYASMLFKYLYAIQLMEIKEELNWFNLSEYEKCKCPIDRLIARSVLSMLPFDKKEERALAWFLSGNSPEDIKYKNISWSRITKPEYIMFQEAVSDICKSFDRKLIPLEFDLAFWEPANIIKEERMKEFYGC